MDGITSLLAQYSILLLYLLIHLTVLCIATGCASTKKSSNPHRSVVDRVPEETNSVPAFSKDATAPETPVSVSCAKEQPTQVGEAFKFDDMNEKTKDEEQKTDLDLMEEDNVWKNKKLKPNTKEKPKKDQKMAKKTATNGNPKKLVSVMNVPTQPSMCSMYTADKPLSPISPASNESKQSDTGQETQGTTPKTMVKTVDTTASVSVFASPSPAGNKSRQSRRTETTVEPASNNEMAKGNQNKAEQANPKQPASAKREAEVKKSAIGPIGKNSLKKPLPNKAVVRIQKTSSSNVKKEKPKTERTKSEENDKQSKMIKPKENSKKVEIGVSTYFT